MSDLRDHSKPCEHGHIDGHGSHDWCREYEGLHGSHCEWCPGGERVTDAVRLADADLEAAQVCPTCDGSRQVPEERGYGLVEMLGCPDCAATGQWLNEKAVRIVLTKVFGRVVPGE